MAPITSYVKLSDHTVLPVRIFINRKEVTKSLKKQHKQIEIAVPSSETRSHRALVRLRSTSPIYLSNIQVSHLCNALKGPLVQHLLTSTDENLKLSSIVKDKDVLRLRVEEDGWSVLLDTSLSFIQGLRSGMLIGGVNQGRIDAPGFLIRIPREMETKEVEGVVLREDEDDVIQIPDEGEVVAPPSDEKKIQKYDYRSMTVLSRGIRVEVLKVPKL